jgi:hypothetical protein
MRHTSLSRLVSSCIILAACSSDDSSSLTGPDTEPPTVDLALSPASLTEAGEITLTADPHDAIGVTRVEFYGQRAGEPGPTRLGEDPAAPYRLAFPAVTDLANGEYQFTAKAYDAAGNVGTSAPRSAVINLPPAPVVFTIEASHDRITNPGRVLFSLVSAEVDLVRFDLYEGATLVATGDPAIPRAELDISGISNGRHGYAARGFDGAGPVGVSNPVEVVVDIRWELSAPTTGIQPDGDFSLAADGSGALYLVGTSQIGVEAAGSVDYDAFLAKYDADGHQLWSRPFADPGVRSYGESVGVDPSGRPFISGIGFDPNNGEGTQCNLAVFSAAGDPVWSVNPGIMPCEAAVDGAGNFYVTRSPPEGVIVTKYDPNGQEQWSRQTRSAPSRPNADLVTSIATDPQGGIYVGGYTSGSLGTPNQGGGRDAFVVKFDAAGNQQWARTFGTTSLDFCNGLAPDPDGGVYVAIGIDNENVRFAQYGDGAIARLGADGTLLWMHQLDGGNYDDAWAVAADRNAVYLVGATTRPVHLPQQITEARQGRADGYLAQYTRDGDLVSIRLLGGPDFDRASGVAVGQSGDAYMTLVTRGGLGGAADLALMIARDRKTAP